MEKVRCLLVGGGPCAGKRLLAGRLGREFSVSVLHTDDRLPGYVRDGAARGYPACRHVLSMSPDEYWSRDYTVLTGELIDVYREIWGFVYKDAAGFSRDRRVIIEGRALLPELVRSFRIGAGEYVAVTAAPELVRSGLAGRRRTLLPLFSECSDPEDAFSRMILRDIYFTQEVNRQAMSLSAAYLARDPYMTDDALYEFAKEKLALRGFAASGSEPGPGSADVRGRGFLTKKQRNEP